jgi:polyphosphate kinase
LAEGLREDLPLLERFRFLSIVSSNFDEFFMVRVAALKRARRSGAGPDPSGLSPDAQLKDAAQRSRALIKAQYDCLRNDLFPGLAREGLELIRPDTYTLDQMDYLESYFLREVYPLLTPLRLTAEKHIHNLTRYGAFLLSAEAAAAEGQDCIAVIQIPPVLDRIVRLPAKQAPAERHGAGKNRVKWALVDDLILTWAEHLFPGYRIRERMLFKINRDADFSVDEKRDEDFIEAMEEVLIRRDSSRAVRMLCSPNSARLLEALARQLDLEEDDIYRIEGPLDLQILADLMELPGFDRLKAKPPGMGAHPALAADQSLWDRISQGDALLHLPYQSFDPVLRFFRDAAADPKVIALKTALYRTSGDSPIIQALEEAALQGKHVTAVVELKARFDEERNISWANRLERAGVIVVYGLARLKVHAKISMVIRREPEGIKRYIHLSTGNYNDRTARYYEDIGLFTAREDIAFDAGLLFNAITGYSVIQTMRHLVFAPALLKDRLIALIDREGLRSSPENPGKIMAKMNSLADPDVIQALYRASQKGVRIRLCVRGVCTLIPGIPGLSEHIEAISVIDFFLEHSRIFYFANAGAEEWYLSSADWMPRNLERRVELMFPLLQKDIQEELRGVLNAYFQDNCQAWRLGEDGAWTRRRQDGEEPFKVQDYLLRRALEADESYKTPKQEFIVRRSPPDAGVGGGSPYPAR